MNDTESYQAYLKSPYKSIKHSTYFEVYDELFSRYKNREITFVEIGVLGGGSLFMWRKFLGPKARIIGVDLNPNAKKWQEYGFEIYIGSQADVNFWKMFIDEVGKVDVILDDGGHTYEQQIVTTEMLLSNVNDNGMLVVEDTHTSYMDGFGPRRQSFVNYTINMQHKINMRFGAFNSLLPDRRVQSIQCFESIIAFHINSKSTCLESRLTNNNGIDDGAIDFRYSENIVDTLQKYLGKYSFLKKVPGVNFIIEKAFKKRLKSLKINF